MAALNEYPAGPAPVDKQGNVVPALQLLHDYRDSILNWEPNGYRHTGKTKRGRAKNKVAKASRKANRGN